MRMSFKCEISVGVCDGRIRLQYEILYLGMTVTGQLFVVAPTHKITTRDGL